MLNILHFGWKKVFMVLFFLNQPSLNVDFVKHIQIRTITRNLKAPIIFAPEAAHFWIQMLQSLLQNRYKHYLAHKEQCHGRKHKHKVI